MKEKAVYRFNCVNGFDANGGCLYPEFRDVSEFSHREEVFRESLEKGDVSLLCMRDFKKHCEVPFPVNAEDWEFYSYTGTQYAPFMYVAYDIERNIHFFFS